MATDSSDGYSGFASYNFTDQISAFGRYDEVKPTQETNSALRDRYYNLGVAYSPVKAVSFALVYKHDKAENGVIGTSNGNIGGVRNGTYDEFGLWGVFAW